MIVREFITRYAAPAAGLTVGQAREANRAFAKAGEPDMVASHPGRGGSPAVTPYNAALILLTGWLGCPQLFAPRDVQPLYCAPHGAAAADESAEIVAEGAGDLAGLHVPLPCPVTGAGVFGDAVRAVLADATLAARVDRIEVRRGTVDATIIWRDGHASRFVSHSDRCANDAQDARGEFRNVAIVGGAILADFARDIA